MAHDLNKDALRSRRATLAAALQRYETGELTHFEEDENGEPTREATGEHIRSLRERIAEIDRQLAEM
jgi:hypothetical protein